MARTSIDTEHSPDAVFAALADGWRYQDWVVGCKRIRDVDEGWPSPGTRFHHSVGVGPLTIDDVTVADAVNPPDRLVLRARAWPAGIARVEITVRAREGVNGHGKGSTIELDEVPVSGAAKLLDSPVLQALTHLRNVESLRRLKKVVASKGEA